MRRRATRDVYCTCNEKNAILLPAMVPRLLGPQGRLRGTGHSGSRSAYLVGRRRGESAEARAGGAVLGPGERVLRMRTSAGRATRERGTHVHDPSDDAADRADEIYQRLMREMRSDLERMLSRRQQVPAA